jgi:hypothetical protein
MRTAYNWTLGGLFFLAFVCGAAWCATGAVGDNGSTLDVLGAALCMAGAAGSVTLAGRRR